MTPSEPIAALLQKLKSDAEVVGRRVEDADAYLVASEVECKLLDAWESVHQRFMPMIDKALSSGELLALDPRTKLPVDSDRWSDTVVALDELREWGRSVHLNFDRRLADHDHESLVWLARIRVPSKRPAAVPPVEVPKAPSNSNGSDAWQLEVADAEDSEAAERLRGLSTSEIVELFGRFRFPLESWKKRLETPALWVAACRLKKGKPGHEQSRWDPLKLALGLRKALQRKYIPGRGTPAELDLVMRTDPQLRPWTSEWRRLNSTFNYRSR